MGNVHAQPLYIEGGPNGPMVIVVTASNNVYALDAERHGDLVWQRNWDAGYWSVRARVTSFLLALSEHPWSILLRDRSSSMQ